MGVAEGRRLNELGNTCRFHVFVSGKTGFNLVIIFRGGLRMRKSIGIALVAALVAVFSLSVASADEMVPGAYVQVDQSVMGERTSGPAFRTQMQIGSHARGLTAAVDLASGAGRSLSNAGSGGGEDFQWGQSQTEQSWKAA